MTDLIELVGAVDGLVQMQARADAEYFFKVCGRTFSPGEAERVRAGVRPQVAVHHLRSPEPRFSKILGGMITGSQADRIGNALAPVMN